MWGGVRGLRSGKASRSLRCFMSFRSLRSLMCGLCIMGNGVGVGVLYPQNEISRATK